ncbi:hypothetical protein BE11_28240 [Sorangium cellulosum]|nr:hypothetical protein BE11_28240 [Sorangium cellulosum]
MSLGRGPAGGFRLALAQESDLPERTSEGNRLSYGFLPGRPKGRWALAVSSAESSCVSLWRTLTTRVLLEGTDPPRPRAAFASSLRFHMPAGYTLAVSAKEFTLRWTGDPTFLPWYPRWDALSARYVVEGDSVRRAPPLAPDAESFVPIERFLQDLEQKAQRAVLLARAWALKQRGAAGASWFAFRPESVDRASAHVRMHLAPPRNTSPMLMTLAWYFVDLRTGKVCSFEDETCASEAGQERP